MLVFKDQTIL